MKIIDYIIKFLFQLVFLITPLFFLFNTSELFEFNKMLLIYTFTVLIAFFWVLKMILAKKIIIKKSFLDWPIFLFLLSQILSTVFSIDKQTSLFGYYGRFNGGLVSIISYIVLYYAFVSNEIDSYSILKISLLSSFLVILYAVPGKLGHDITCFLVSKGTIIDNSCWDNSVLQFQPDVRAFSTLGQPNWFGAYLVVNFFIGLWFLSKQSKITNLLTFIYLLFNFTFIIFSRSRSALLAVIIGLIIYFLTLFFYKRNYFKKHFLLLIIIIFLPILFFNTGIDKIEKTKNQISNIFFKKSNTQFKNNLEKKENKNVNITDSADIRKIVWQGAIKLGLQYPFFGTGVETFAYSYNFTRPLTHNYTSEWDFIYNKAHNEFLNYLATTGFFGLISYLILIFSFQFLVFNQFLKPELSNKNKKLIDEENYDKKTLFLCFLIAYLTILITNFFGFSTTTINLYFYLIPGLVINIINLEKKEKDKKQKLEISKLNFDKIFLILILIGISYYLLLSIYKYYQADTYYALGNGYTKLSNPDYQKAAFYFDKALQTRYEHVYEDKLSFNLAYLSAIAGLQKQNKDAQDLIKISNFYNNRSLLNSQKNIFYLKTKAKNQYYFFLATGTINYLYEGIKVLKQAKKIAPTDPRIPYSLAVYYSLIFKNSKDKLVKEEARKNALKEINESLKLKKDYSDALELMSKIKSN